MDIHVFGCDSPYNKAFVEFMNRNFPRRGDAYVALWKKEAAAFPLPEQGNILYMQGDDFTKYKIIYELFEKGERIFAHSLFEPALSFFADYPGKKKFLYIPWGSDIAPFIFRSPYDRMDGPTRRFFQGNRLNLETYQEKAAEWDMWRKMNLVTAKMSHILHVTTFNQNVIKYVFKKNIETLPFQYYNPVDFGLMDGNEPPSNPEYIFKPRFAKVIQLANSGNAANNHISAINELSKVKRDDFCVVAPLSYGDPNAIELVAKYGLEKLGERFIPLRKFLPAREYAAILRQVDTLLINTYYSGGSANIALVLYNGGKVMLNSLNASSYMVFKAFNIDLPPITTAEGDDKTWVDDIFKPLDQEVAAANSKNIQTAYSEQHLSEQYSNILEKTAQTL